MSLHEIPFCLHCWGEQTLSSNGLSLEDHVLETDYQGALVAGHQGASMLWSQGEMHLIDTRVLQPQLLLPQTGFTKTISASQSIHDTPDNQALHPEPILHPDCL